MSNLAARREWKGDADRNVASEDPIDQVYTCQAGTENFAGVADHTIRFTKDPDAPDPSAGYRMDFWDNSTISKTVITSKTYSLRYINDSEIKIARVCGITMNKNEEDRAGCCVTVAMIDLGPGAKPRYKLSGAVRGYNSGNQGDQSVFGWLPRWILKLFHQRENPLSGTWTATSG